MGRSHARKRPIPRIRHTSRGNSYGYGVIVNDHVSGLPVPLSETVAQRGGRVSRKWADGTRDRHESY